jgi:hypothetical protein
MDKPELRREVLRELLWEEHCAESLTISSSFRPAVEMVSHG